MAKIIAPVRGYNGVSATVRFVQGVGQTDDPYLLDWFRAKGYTVVEERPVETEAETTPENIDTKKPKKKTGGE